MPVVHDDFIEQEIAWPHGFEVGHIDYLDEVGSRTESRNVDRVSSSIEPQLGDEHQIVARRAWWRHKLVAAAATQNSNAFLGTPWSAANKMIVATTLAARSDVSAGRTALIRPFFLVVIMSCYIPPARQNDLRVGLAYSTGCQIDSNFLQTVARAARSSSAVVVRSW